MAAPLDRRRTSAIYARFIADVEPAIAARPRVHRFARVPAVADRAAVPGPLAVCIEPRGSLSGGRTHASLERQTVPPAQVLEGDLTIRLGESRADWVAIVAAGDLLRDDALERLGQAVTLASDAAVIGCDDDLLDRAGRRSTPRLRPGPSPDLWATVEPDYALMTVGREAALAALRGGEGSRNDLFRRLAGEHGDGHAHVPLVLCHRRELGAMKRSQRGSARAPRARGQAERRLSGEPGVEVIIPFRDRPALLERCTSSLLGRSSYDRLRLRLIDNGSADAETAGLVARLAREPRVRVARDPRPFNFSALMNAAASRSDADFLIFLNNDTEITTPDWIEALLAQAQRPEVGAVAPLLVLPDGRVQHAGVALGIHGWAGHPFAGLRPDDHTVFGAAVDGPRNWLAVSAACMMVEKRKLIEVGGFDESFSVGGGDVDLCLRLTAAGYRSLCIPRVRLVHDESASRDPSAVPPGDFEASRRSYGAFRTVGDPFYHPALTLEDTTCRLRAPDEPLAAP